MHDPVLLSSQCICPVKAAPHSQVMPARTSWSRRDTSAARIARCRVPFATSPYVRARSALRNLRRSCSPTTAIPTFMDPLSDVLSLLRPHSRLYASFDTAGAWSLFFPPYHGIKCAAVLQGECWGSVDGMAQPVHLAAGDCFLLNRGTGITLSTDPSLPPQDSSAVLEAIEREGIAVHNGGEVLLIGAFFSFPNDHAAMLLDALPSFVNSPHLTRQADIQRWALDQLKSELLEPLPGGMLVANHLLHLMLVQMLRHH